MCRFFIWELQERPVLLFLPRWSVWWYFWVYQKETAAFVFRRKMCGSIRICLRKWQSLGAPIALQDLLVSISFLIILAIVNSMGVTASAGVGVAEKVCAFIMLISSAFMQSMSAFVAQNYGAGRMDRAKKALYNGIGQTKFVMLQGIAGLLEFVCLYRI